MAKPLANTSKDILADLITETKRILGPSGPAFTIERVNAIGGITRFLLKVEGVKLGRESRFTGKTVLTRLQGVPTNSGLPGLLASIKGKPVNTPESKMDSLVQTLQNEASITVEVDHSDLPDGTLVLFFLEGKGKRSAIGYRPNAGWEYQGKRMAGPQTLLSMVKSHHGNLP